MLANNEEAMTSAVVRELVSGRQFLDSLQKYRETDAARIAADYRKLTPKKGGWRHLAEIPQREYLQMAQKYGNDCWHDRGFIKDFQRLEPTMASNKL